MKQHAHSDARLRWLGPVGVTALGAAFRLVDFGRVPPNPFYDAAVRSMSLSWHNFFYGAFEPGGQVSIDKMPVDLWLQVLSTRLFGFGSVALRLPEVIAGILTIPLLYDLVRRLFGRAPGLVSAVVLAVLPISVVTARSDTMDSVMMLLVLGAAWMVVRARETCRARPLVGAGALMGLAFGVKLFEALIVLPALVVLFVVASELSVRARLTQLLLAGVAFVGVGTSWLVAVSLSPSGNRPFPIGSTDGTVWDVVFGYNGIDRLAVKPSQAALALDPPGITRLFVSTGALDGWLVGSSLVAALALGGGAVATYAWQHSRNRVAGDAISVPERQRRAGAWFFGVWLLVGVVLFSDMGRLQPRYLEAFTASVAATTGIGIWWLAKTARAHRPTRILLALSVLSTALLAPYVADSTPGAQFLTLAAGILTVMAATAPSILRVGAPLVALLAAVTVCAVPTASTVKFVRRAAESSGRPGYAPPTQVAALSRYLKAHQGRARYEGASTNVYSPGPLIARDGRPILMLTSLHGRPLVSAKQLSALVRRGDVKYALFGRGTCLSPVRAPKRCQTSLTWVRAHGIDVSHAAGQARKTVYRLSVQARRSSSERHKLTSASRRP